MDLKSFDLGSEKPFEPAKWSKEVVDGIQFLTVTDNEEPILKVTGSSVDVPIRIRQAGVETRLTLVLFQKIKIHL